MEIRKKLWKVYFDRVSSGQKKFEIRLADFACEPGDTLILDEWDPDTHQYTGRHITKKITYVAKTKDCHFWNQKEIEEHGFQIIQIE
jgi:ASC-1-like (ASCH) protein